MLEKRCLAGCGHLIVLLVLENVFWKHFCFLLSETGSHPVFQAGQVFCLPPKYQSHRHGRHCTARERFLVRTRQMRLNILEHSYPHEYKLLPTKCPDPDLAAEVVISCFTYHFQRLKIQLTWQRTYLAYKEPWSQVPAPHTQGMMAYASVLNLQGGGSTIMSIRPPLAT